MSKKSSKKVNNENVKLLDSIFAKISKEIEAKKSGNTSIYRLGRATLLKAKFRADKVNLGFKKNSVKEMKDMFSYGTLKERNGYAYVVDYPADKVSKLNSVCQFAFKTVTEKSKKSEKPIKEEKTKTKKVVGKSVSKSSSKRHIKKSTKK